MMDVLPGCLAFGDHVGEAPGAANPPCGLQEEPLSYGTYSPLPSKILRQESLMVPICSFLGRFDASGTFSRNCCVVTVRWQLMQPWPLGDESHVQSNITSKMMR